MKTAAGADLCLAKDVQFTIDKIARKEPENLHDCITLDQKQTEHNNATSPLEQA